MIYNCIAPYSKLAFVNLRASNGDVLSVMERSNDNVVQIYSVYMRQNDTGVVYVFKTAANTYVLVYNTQTRAFTDYYTGGDSRVALYWVSSFTTHTAVAAGKYTSSAGNDN